MSAKIIRKTFFIVFFLLIAVAPLFSQATNNYQNIQKTNIAADSREKFLFLLFENANREQLKLYCEQNGLSTTGSMTNLRERLYEHFKLIKEKPAEEKKIEEKREVIKLERADEAEYLKISQDEEVISVSGNVKLLYGNKDLRADRIKINVKARDLLCEGNVTLIEGDQVLEGDKLL